MLWHRRLAPFAVFTIIGHVGLTVLGYSLEQGTTVTHEAWTLVTTYRWMLPATAAFLLFVGLALIIAIPDLCLWLPRTAGLIR